MIGASAGGVEALQVSHAQGDEEVLAGHVYVAPPDQHLLLTDGRTSVPRGPRQRGERLREAALDAAPVA